MKLCAIQLVSSDRIEANWQRIVELSQQAAQQGADVIVLPENALALGVDYRRNLAEPLANGPWQQRFAALAKSLNAHLVIGSFPTIFDARRCYSTSLHYDRCGTLLSHYHKRHLFDAEVGDGIGRYRESDLFAPGHELVVSPAEQLTLGLSICYDLRFAAHYQGLRELGADVLLVPAAFTAVTGAAHWLPLLRARAIEQQCYIVAPNQGGEHGRGRSTYGHSLIIDPWGEVLAQAQLGEAVIIAKADSSRLNQVRQAMPVLAHHQAALQALQP